MARMLADSFTLKPALDRLLETPLPLEPSVAKR
jgi:hypothetical protein